MDILAAERTENEVAERLWCVDTILKTRLAKIHVRTYCQVIYMVSVISSVKM